MKEKDFKELLNSVKEVGLMEQGQLQPSREFVTEKAVDLALDDMRSFAICLSDEDEGLIPLKIYQIRLQPELGTCTVIDENNETSVCPLDWFLPVEFASKIEKLLEEKELALA